VYTFLDSLNGIEELFARNVANEMEIAVSMASSVCAWDFAIVMS
jgi:hypothetical protein